jgi:hypothetical protein
MEQYSAIRSDVIPQIGPSLAERFEDGLRRVGKFLDSARGSVVSSEAVRISSINMRRIRTYAFVTLPLAFTLATTACGPADGWVDNGNCVYRKLDENGNPYGPNLIDNTTAHWENLHSGDRVIKDCGPTWPGYIQVGGPR